MMCCDKLGRRALKKETYLDTEVKAKIIGVSSQMKTFDFYFGVKVSKLILQMTSNLSRTLQHEHLSVSEGQSVAQCTIKPGGHSHIGSY